MGMMMMIEDRRPYKRGFHWGYVLEKRGKAFRDQWGLTLRTKTPHIGSKKLAKVTNLPIKTPFHRHGFSVTAHLILAVIHVYIALSLIIFLFPNPHIHIIAYYCYSFIYYTHHIILCFYLPSTSILMFIFATF